MSAVQNTYLFGIGDDVGTKNFDIAFLANRSGTIAASQLTFIVALAGKNNIVSCTSICKRLRSTDANHDSSPHGYQLREGKN